VHRNTLQSAWDRKVEWYILEKEFENKRKEILARDKEGISYDSQFEFRNALEIPSIFRDFKTDNSDLILEVGAGTGRITVEFVKRGAKVVALDYSVRSLKINRARSNCQAVLADICYLPFKSSIFNKAASISVFQHIPTAQARLRGLKEVRRVLKEGAPFLIMAYNNQLLDKLRRDKEGYHSSTIYYHKFDLLEFKFMLLSVFSKITKNYGVFIFPPPMWKFIVRWIGIKVALSLEDFIEKTFLSFLLGDHILAICKK